MKKCRIAYIMSVLVKLMKESNFNTSDKCLSFKGEEMDKIIVLGGKGSAVVIAEQIYDAQCKMGNVEFLGFAFDDPEYGKEINGFPLLCHTYEAYEKYEKYNDVKFIYQLYRPDLMKVRIDLRESFRIPIERYAIFIHPMATVARSAQIGVGTVILANAVVNSNVRIGNHVTIQSNTLIGHDTEVADSTFFAAHSVIGSNNKIGEGVFFGLNTSVNNYTEIGDFAFVGMASNVIKSIPENAMVYGNPAKQVKRKIKPL